MKTPSMILRIIKNKRLLVNTLVLFLLLIFVVLFKLFYSPYHIYSSLLISDSNIDAKLIAKNIGIKMDRSGEVYRLEDYSPKILEKKTIYSNKRALIKIKNFEIQTYKTKVEIASMKSNPLRREAKYAIYNASRYFILSMKEGNSEIKITDKYGNPVKFSKIKIIKDLEEEWKNNPLWVREVKKDLSSKGIKANDLKELFYKEILPDKKWINTLYYIEDNNLTSPLYVTIITKPQYSFKFYYFDPVYSGWWNESWQYRSKYYLHNNNDYSLDNYPIFIKLNSTNFPWDLAKSDLSDIRVTEFNETTQTEVEIPYFLEYVDVQNKEGYVWIRAQNFTANSNITIFIYHDNPNAIDESNVTAVASFADDFESGSLDTTKWNAVGTVSVETDPIYGNGMLRVDGGNQITGACTSTYNVANSSIVGYYARPESTADWDSGISIGGIYFISDTGSSDAPPIISNGWTYPSGSQGPDTSYHFYRVYVSDDHQTMTDYTSQQSTSATYAYTPGSLCTVTDSDNTARDALYDVIYVMELPDNETLVVYNSTEYIGKYNTIITHPSNNQIVYRYNSFYLNSSIEARGFDLYDTGSKIIQDYNDFVKYDYKENISVIDNIGGKDFIELESSSDWYQAFKDWQYRMPINITNPNTNDLQDFQIALTIDTQSLITSGKMNSDCSDMRFTYYNTTGNYEVSIPHWIESGCNTANTKVWVKVPFLPANGNSTLYLYYGNSYAINIEDPNNVFDFYDDFESGSLDTNKWQSSSYTTIVLDSTTNTYAAQVATGNQIIGICTKNNFNAPFIIESNLRPTSTGDFDSGWLVSDIYFVTDTGTGAPDINQGSWTYPAGSQDTTSYHLYYLEVNTNSQYMLDTTNGQSASATYTYTPGQICFINDGDGSASSLYDDIRVRKLASNMNFVQTDGSEEQYLSTYPSGDYISKVIDLQTSEYSFDKFYWYGINNPNADTRFYIRTSNDGSTWSVWYLMANNTIIEASPARYIQYKLLMNNLNGNSSDIIDKVVIGYRTTTGDFAIMTPSSIFSTNNPVTCSLSEIKQNPNSKVCNVSWSIIPKQEGNYTLRVKVNSSNQYIPDAYSQKINISVFIKTSIIEFTINPSVQGQGRNISLTAKLVNDLSQPLEGYNITFYDSTTNKVYGTVKTDSNGYAILTYTIPKDEVLGYHTVYAIFNRSWKDFLEGSNVSLTYKVSSVPQINSLYAIPSWQGNNQTIELKANVTDKVGINEVDVYVYDSKGNVLVNGLPMSNIYSDIYEYNFSSWQPDKYYFYVIAKNIDGIENQSEKVSFVIDVRGELSVKTQKDKYKNYERVYLSNYAEEWYNTSWKYMLPIELYNPNEDEIFYDTLNITLNTSRLISQGKMRSDCGDLRFAVKKNIYVTEINITNNNAVSFTDRPVKITINDMNIVNNMNEDGSDIRVFESKVESPYSNNTYLPYWVEKINKETGTLTLWIKIPYIAAYETKTLYLYYGNKNAIDKQNYTAIFDQVIGEARIYTINSTEKTINFIRSYSQPPIIISSLNTFNGQDPAFVRITSVSPSSFNVKIQESIGTSDGGSHVYENASYIAILPGKWLIGGKYVEVGTADINSTYSTISFQNTFPSKPLVFTQILTNNEQDPAKTRIDGINTVSFNAKIEETDTTDTPHTYETIGYVAFPIFSLASTNFLWESGLKNHDQASSTTWYYYSLKYFNSIPAVIAKILTENGPDNSHERIKDTTAKGFYYKIEEEQGYDGPHIAEDNGYWALKNNSLIYGLPYGDYSFPTTIGQSEKIGSTYVDIPYWIEDGCNTANTKVWVQVPHIPSKDSSLIYAFYGNPSITTTSNKSNVFSYPFKKPLYYVLDGDIVSGDLQVGAYEDTTSLSIGGYSGSLNKGQISTISSSELSLGAALESDKPLSTTTLISGDGDALTPKIALGKEFMLYAIRGVEYLTFKAFYDNTKIEVYDVNSGTFTKIMSLTLNKEDAQEISYDFADGHSIYINATNAILLHRRAETNYDLFTVFPPARGWYGVPSQYGGIVALKPNTQVTIYRSDQSAPSIYSLTNAGDVLTFNNLGAAGDAPAFYVSADKPVYAFAWADGDGTEGTTFIPEKELEDEYLIPADAEYVAIATKDAVATCYVYDANGNLLNTQSTTYTSSTSPFPGKVKFGAVSVGNFINCTSPFFAYFERANRYETNLYGIKHFRNEWNYSIQEKVREEEDVYNNLKNNGNTTMKGHLIIYIEHKTSNTWEPIIPFLLNDLSSGTTRVLSPGEEINITYLFNNQIGGWDTGINDPGMYRVVVKFVGKDASDILKDSYGNSFIKTYEFEIVPSELRVTSIDHENLHKVGIKEYEVGDKIDWVNISVKAYNNTAINAEVELDLVKPDKSYAGFGPLNEIYDCGNIPYEGVCYAFYDNSSNGYPIPLNVSGVYMFYWNVTMTLQNGDAKYNGSEYIVIHDLRNNISSTINPTRIYIGQNQVAYYNLTIYNLWSKNLTKVNITINCDDSLNCTCALPGQEGQQGYCYLENITSNTYAYANFSINTTPSTAQNDYIINSTIYYVNPGNETKLWEEIAPQTLEVRYQGILAIDPYYYPSDVIRGYGGYSFNASINNTASSDATHAWLNYTLPTGWIVAKGSENSSTPSLPQYALFWNNITVNITSSSSLGSQEVVLKSSSDQGQEDFKRIYVNVWGQPQVVNITFNDTNTSIGESVEIKAKLIDDLGNPVSGKTLNFYDATDGVFIGSSTTNIMGYAIIIYTIPSTASLGLHTINVSFSKDSSSYLLYADNQSYLDIGLKPRINKLWHDPYEISYGGNISIYANITDDDGINSVSLYVKYPNGTTYNYPMSNIYGDVYNYNLTDLWDYGSYYYYVKAEDIVGSVNTSVTKTFRLTSYAQVYAITDNTTYPPNTNVYLVAHKGDWVYKDRYYKKEIEVENVYSFALNKSFVLITMNTSKLIKEGKLDDKCQNLAFSYFNTTLNKEVKTRHYVVPGSCNSEKTYVYVEIPYLPTGTNVSVFAYYDPHKYVKKYIYDELNITTYDKNVTIHYPLSTNNAGSDAYAISYKDGYLVTPTTTYYLPKGVPTLISQADLAQNTPISHAIPVFIASTNNHGDAFPVIAYAGKRFTYVFYRGADVFYVFAPWQDANCNLYDSTTLKDSFTVTKGTVASRNNNIRDGNAGILECDQPVIAFHDAGEDTYIMYPASKEWYGVASNYLMIAALEDNTQITIYKSTGSSNIITLNRGEAYVETGLGSQGNGPAVHVIANKPIGVNSIADGDGTEGTTFLPPWELSKKYYIPEDFEYIAIAVPYPYTKCDLKISDNGALVSSYTIGSLSSNVPGHVLFGSGNGGYVLECNNSVFAYYEPSATNDETNLLGMLSNRLGYGYNATIQYNGNEETQRSLIINHGNTSMYFRIVAFVERNTSNGWDFVKTIINDSFSGTLKYLDAYDSYDISSLWNATPFNTDLYPKGTYRVHVMLVDKNGNVMDGYYSMLENTTNFNISTGTLKLNITSIRVYNVTNSLNPHTSTLNLMKESINDTFVMYTGEVYRIEVDVNVLSDSAIWYINTTNITYEELNGSWIINPLDIWYMNTTDRATNNERVGGKFYPSGVLEWNTTYLDGKEDPNGKVVFYFILNLTNAIPETKHVIFKVSGPEVGEQDISTFKIVYLDNTPPLLYRNTYGANASYLIRGESLKVYARWIEEISYASIEYNSTSPTLVKYDIPLPSPNPYNWTNYTLTTTPTWLLGNHSFKIYAQDLSGNVNDTLPYLIIPVYGLAYISDGSINNTSPSLGDFIRITCGVKDSTLSPPQPIEQYPVYFYNGTTLIGINYTNSSGYASFIYQDLTPGYEILRCNITDNKSMFYLADPTNNEKSFTLFTKETQPPYYTKVLENRTLIHKGDAISLDVYWHDNYQLDYAILEMNDTGSYYNHSTMYLDHLTDAWSNFTYVYPTSYSPGFVSWRVYANDTSGNYNVTPYNLFEVWGWAKLNSITLSPASMYVGNSTIISCKVIDANSTQPLQNYEVYFYNDTVLLGVNYTNSQGIATWNYTDYTANKEKITCEIRDNITRMYNASSPSNISTYLNTVYSGDAIPPKIVNNLYGLNVSYTDKVYRDESVLLYALWDEAINYSWREINTTSSSMEYYYVPSSINNWTNHTIKLNYSWLVGTHYVKLYANDTSGNINDTLPYLNFTVWGFSKVQWISPVDGQEVNRSTIYLVSNVTDYDNGKCILGYKVDYYDNVTAGYYLGSAYVENGCKANFSWDASTTDVGYHELKAIISNEPSLYYDVKTGQDIITIIVVILGALNTTIVSPSDGQKLYRGQAYWFNSTTLDENNQPITPEEVDWYINGSLVSTAENFSYTFPTTSVLGIKEIKAYSKAAYYQRGQDVIYVDLWSKANITMNNPSSGETVYVKNTVPIECNVSDYLTGNPIEGYKVDFYIENSTYSEHLGSAYTDANGIATYNWYVDNTKYMVGNLYDVRCSISSNTTLRYDPNIANAVSKVYVNETTGILIVNLTFPQPNVKTYVPKNQNFYINATITCKIGVCGDVNATALYNNRYMISTTIGTQPFYINDGLPNPRNCMQNMQPDQSCNVSFLVNATGDYASVWNISVWANSSLGMSNTSENAELYIGYVILMSVEPSNITYWYLPPTDPTQNYISPPVKIVDPSTSMIKAANTTEVKILPGSADANGGLWIKGENLTSSTSTSVIPVWNITRCLGRIEDYPTPQSAQACWSDPVNKLRYNYTQILPSVLVGDWINITLFIDVPPVYAGTYNGSIWIMANASY